MAPRRASDDEDLRQGVDGDRVEAGERLVEDQHVGLVDEGADQLDALLVAERQVLEVAARPVGEVEALEPRLGAAARLGLVEAAQLAEVAQLVADPHRRVQPALLGEVAEAPAGVGVDRAALPAHGAGVEGGEPEDRPHRRRLAGAVGPEEAGDGARVAR